MRIDEVLATFTNGDIRQSITLMRKWLDSAAPGEPEKLLEACPAALKGRVVLLMRDLLSRYPATLLGAPVLLMCTPDSENPSAANRFLLPHPPAEHKQPCSELHFVGWLAADTPLPVQLPYHPKHHEVYAEMGQVTTAVALFRSHPGVFDLDELVLPNSWWGELFRAVDANIQLSARLLLPYPDALEAAQVLSGTVCGGELSCAHHFLSDNGWAWARDCGELFKESCRNLHRHLSE